MMRCDWPVIVGYIIIVLSAKINYTLEYFTYFTYLFQNKSVQYFDTNLFIKPYLCLAKFLFGYSPKCGTFLKMFVLVWRLNACLRIAYICINGVLFVCLRYSSYLLGRYFKGLKCHLHLYWFDFVLFSSRDWRKGQANLNAIPAI